MVTVHGIPCSSSRIPGPVGAWIHWCGLCGRYLSQLQDLDDHAAQHEQILGEIIRTEGFTGLMLRRMTIRPPLNPFDVYNTSLQPSARYKLSYNHHHKVEEAMGSHIDNLDDNGRFACPASIDAGEHIKAACSQQYLMSKDQLRSHMTEAHGIRPQNARKEANANRAKKNKNVPEASGIDDGAQESKRLKGNRRIASLHPKRVNAAVGASMESHTLRP